MQEITIGPMAAYCAASGRQLRAGERVTSFLCLGEEGLQRLDVLSSELAGFALPERVLCRWSSQVREPMASEAMARRAANQTIEEIFLNLIDAEPVADAAAAAARERLLYFLALQLERKRVLRPVGKRVYLHVRSKRLLEVPQLELTAELVRDFRSGIESLFFLK